MNKVRVYFPALADVLFTHNNIAAEGGVRKSAKNNDKITSFTFLVRSKVRSPDVIEGKTLPMFRPNVDNFQEANT